MNLHNSNMVFQSTAHTREKSTLWYFYTNEFHVKFHAIQEEVLLMKCHNSLFGKCTALWQYYILVYWDSVSKDFYTFYWSTVDLYDYWASV